ncbi:SRPBCC family protein [bacterium]|nr:SRPBCC family protein [bacterium]MCI0601909.1 SRPBCC family protein [bacterium]
MITPKNFSVNREGREITGERIFDAPRQLVWKLWTDPDLIPQWWGPKKYKTTVEKMDFRPGGVWRFIQQEPNGNEYAFSGEYREIVPPERLVYTFNFEPIGPGHELIEVVTFEEINGKTKMTNKAIYKTIEDLEGMLRSGMEEGAMETMARFDELLRKHS